jgi:hypothetical protein
MKKMICLVLIVPFLAVAQCVPPYYRVPLICSDIGTGIDTLSFGFHYDATYGINPTLCEYELPPIPPTGVFDVRFVNIDGHNGQDAPAGLGQGTLRDYRIGHGIDTFRVKFQPGESGFPFLFRWSVLDVWSIADSAILQDEFGGFLVKARMHNVNSVQVYNPAFNSLLLIVYGPFLDVQEPDDGKPNSFALSQNYPNPFNPSTEIRFQITDEGWATLRVYDVLGREVATLVDEVKHPGAYTARWDASGQSSGVYIYRLKNGNFVQTQRMMLIR